MMPRSDATSVGGAGPLADPGRTRRVAPYATAALVGVLAMPFDHDAAAGARWIGAGLTAVAIAIALAVRWPQQPRSAQLVPPALQLAAVAICIRADGGLASPYLSLLVFPVLWLAVYESRRAFGFGLAAASSARKPGDGSCVRVHRAALNCSDVGVSARRSAKCLLRSP